MGLGQLGEGRAVPRKLRAVLGRGSGRWTGRGSRPEGPASWLCGGHHLPLPRLRRHLPATKPSWPLLSVLHLLAIKRLPGAPVAAELTSPVPALTPPSAFPELSWLFSEGFFPHGFENQPTFPKSLSRFTGQAPAGPAGPRPHLRPGCRLPPREPLSPLRPRLRVSQSLRPRRSDGFLLACCQGGGQAAPLRPQVRVKCMEGVRAEPPSVL